MRTIATDDPRRLLVYKSVCLSVSHTASRGFAVQNTDEQIDRGPVWDGDSWGPKEHCIQRESRFPSDSMRPSPNYYGYLLYLYQHQLLIFDYSTPVLSKM